MSSRSRKASPICWPNKRGPPLHRVHPMTTMTTPEPHHRRHRRPATSPNPRRHVLLLLVLASLVCSTEAQSPGSDSQGSYSGLNGNFNPSMAIIIVVLISAFFFMGFFSIYIRQCSERADPSIRPSGPGGGARSRRAVARGLGPAVIESFPTLVYSDVKEHKIGKGALECAVCLSEFDDDDTLRLLPKCDHVFHPDCIDAWLSAHTTCPVCRANLAPDPNAPPAAAAVAPAATADHSPAEANASALTGAAVVGADGDERERDGAGDAAVPAAVQSDHIAITIEEPAALELAEMREEAPALRPPIDRMKRSGSTKNRLPWRSKSSVRPPRFPRSHSTGHSMTVVQPGEDYERYTLRLPEHIRRDIMAGKLQRSSSCAVMHGREEGSTRKGNGGGVGEGGGEGTSRGGGSIGGRSFKLRRWEWVAKSDRWAFFARTFSMKIPRGEGPAEGSTRRGEGFTRRGGGAEGGGDDVSGEGSVKVKLSPTVRSPFDCLGGGGGEEEEAFSKKVTAATARV